VRTGCLMALGILAGITLATGCQSAGTQRQDEVAQAWQHGPQPDGQRSATARRSSQRFNPDSPVAVVNGRTITWGALQALLVSSHGLSALQQLILLTLAEDLAAGEQITVNDLDVQAEYDRALGDIVPQRDEAGRPLDPKQRQAELQRLIEGRGISQEEFRLNMRVNALLRKVAERHVQVGEADVQAEYKLRYGERVQIRHIQMPTLREINQVVQRLADGEDFSAVARTYSKNMLTGPDGGLLPAFTYVDASVPAALREAAFRLQPGQTSKPIKIEGEYHVIKLERRIPAQPIELAAVRDELKDQVRDRLVREKMKQMRDAMVSRCSIRVLDADLRRAYNEGREKLTGPLPPAARP
jgi:foldase protein PrsA